MGSLTRGQIVSNGLLRAGDTSLTAPANVWLNAWLRKQYASAPWPFLKARSDQVALPAGNTPLLFGAGAVVSYAVNRIHDPVLLRDSTFSSVRKLRVRELLDSPLSQDESVQNPAQFVGTPSWLKIKPVPQVWGQWALVATPFPERAYLLTIDHVIQPDDLASDASVPPYPNDETMIQAVIVAALQDMNSDLAQLREERDLLKHMTVDDRVRYMQVPGTNDKWQLDGRNFSSYPAGRGWWWLP